MKITKTGIVNFRNIRSSELELSENVNIFCGENGQGKTNFVESVLVCLTGRSHRENIVKNFINDSSKACKVRINALKDDNTSHEISMMCAETKTHLLDNAAVKKRSELLEYFPVIFFGPDDLRIIKDSPEVRRKFLNDAISITTPVYDTLFNEYIKLLRQRNALLKTYSPSDVYMLEVYDEMISTQASRIIIARMKYLGEFSKVFSKTYAHISDGREDVCLGYVSEILKSETMTPQDIKDAYLNMLTVSRQEDIFARTTTKGIHHDDISVFMNEKSARKFSSQGQQRALALSMKLACADMLYEKRHTRALILLDDVMSELDDRRKQSILSALSDYQTAITCVKPDFEFDKTKTTVFNVKNGVITQ